MDGRARSTSSISRGSHRRAAKSPADFTNDLTKLLSRAAGAVATPAPQPVPAPVIPPGRHHADQPAPVAPPPPPRFRLSRPQVFAAAAVAAAAIVAVPLLLIWTPGEEATGTTTSPASRGYACRPGNRVLTTFTACRAAAAVRPATGDEPAVGLGDGTDIGIPDVGDRHREVIPDTRLCSAGRERYRGLDLARDDWPTTDLKSGGTTTLVYRLDDRHAGTLRFYLTKPGYDATQPLTWGNLDTKPIGQAKGKPGADNAYHVTVKLPQRTGRHLLYTIWDSADSDQALYACSDVLFGGSGGGSAPANAARAAAPKPSPSTAAAESPAEPTESPEPTGESTESSAWEAGVRYEVGDVVVYDDVTYRCLQPHRSVHGWEPDSAPALWEPAVTR